MTSKDIPFTYLPHFSLQLFSLEEDEKHRFVHLSSLQTQHIRPCCLRQLTGFVIIQGHVVFVSTESADNISQWLSAASGDIRDSAFLFQRLAVTIQRFNSVLLMESFGDLDAETDCWPF